MRLKKNIVVAYFAILGFAFVQARPANNGAPIVSGEKKIILMFSSYAEETGKIHFFVMAHGLQGMQLERMQSMENKKITHRMSVEPPATSEMDKSAPCQISTIFEPSPMNEEKLTFRICEPESNGPSIFLVLPPNQCGMVTIGESSNDEQMTGATPMSPQCPTGCFAINAYSERCGSFKKCCGSTEFYIDFVSCKVYCTIDCHGGES